MIKNIEDLKKVQIVCRKIDQVEDCYNHLEQLGFKVSYYGREGFFLLFVITMNCLVLVIMARWQAINI